MEQHPPENALLVHVLSQLNRQKEFPLFANIRQNAQLTLQFTKFPSQKTFGELLGKRKTSQILTYSLTQKRGLSIKFDNKKIFFRSNPNPHKSKKGESTFSGLERLS